MGLQLTLNSLSLGVSQVEKIDDPSDNLFVFFPEDTKVGVKPIRK